jgi:hypothetical protein
MEPGMETIVNKIRYAMPRKRDPQPIDPILKFAIENKDYFSWPLEIKKEACSRLAIWLTNLSFMGEYSRQELINLQIEEAIKEEEFEYCEFVRDVETFFRTKNWKHLV